MLARYLSRVFWQPARGADDLVAFIDASEQDVAEVNRPDAVVHLLEAHGMLLECVREKEQPLREPNRAGVRDALGCDPVGRTEIRRIASPDSRVEAVLVEGSGGATTDFFYEIQSFPVGAR